MPFIGSPPTFCGINSTQRIRCRIHVGHMNSISSHQQIQKKTTKISRQITTLPKNNKNKKSPFVSSLITKILVLSLLCLKFTTTFWRKKKKSLSRIRTINRLFCGDFFNLDTRLIKFLCQLVLFCNNLNNNQGGGLVSVENHRISKLKTATACCSIAH